MPISGSDTVAVKLLISELQAPTGTLPPWLVPCALAPGPPVYDAVGGTKLPEQAASPLMKTNSANVRKVATPMARRMQSNVC